jgi:dihydropteroate synthase
VRPPDAVALAGGWGWFTHAEVLSRNRSGRVIPAADIPAGALSRLTGPRTDIAGLSMEHPRLMGILNVTPDSFSDGGRFLHKDAALAQAGVMGSADMLDIGGESTRPGSAPVSVAEEIARTAPVIAALRQSFAGVISIDTRKSEVARAALESGATMLNDVSAMEYDAGMAPLAAERDVPICLMHAQGTPETMQADPQYDNVLLDVYDALAEWVERAVAAGIDRSRIVIDPGIGFGKTMQHNLILLAGLSLFHGLGCPILLGASRKRFIGTLGNAPDADDRMPGSIAVALAGVAQGVQILRVHDISQTRQALTLWRAATRGTTP